jgi:hypothetical protein
LASIHSAIFAVRAFSMICGIDHGRGVNRSAAASPGWSGR